MNFQALTKTEITQLLVDHGPNIALVREILRREEFSSVHHLCESWLEKNKLRVVR